MLRFILIATYLWGLSVPALATRGHFIKDQRPAVGIVDGNYDDADGEFELLTQVWDDFVMSQSDPDPGFDSGAYDMVDLQPDDNENGNFDAALASVESFLGGAEVMTMQRLILPLPEDYNAEEAEEEVIEELAALHAASKLKVEIKEEEFGDEEDAKDISTMPGEEREFVQEIVFRGHFDAGGQEADFTVGEEGLHPTPVLFFGSGQPHNQVPTISTSYVTNIFFSRPSQGAILAHGNAVMDHLTLAMLLLMTVAMTIFFMHTICGMRGGASGLSSQVVLERSGEDGYVLVRGTAGLKQCAHYAAELDAKA